MEKGNQPTLEEQEAAIKTWCEEQRLELVQVFEEASEADEEVQKREVLKAMRQAIEQDEANGVIVARYDRLCQSLVEGRWLTDGLLEKGKDFIALEERLNTATTEGLHLFQMTLKFCQQERTWVQERQLSKTQERVRAGHKPSSFNFGYERNEEGVLVPVPEQADLVKQVFRLYEENQSVQKVVDFLNHELGARTRRGNKWTPKSLYNILTNVVYIGKVKWRGEVVEGRHEPLIEVQTFERVNLLLSMNRRGGRRGRQISKRMKYYTSEIVEESLHDISILKELKQYLTKEKVKDVPEREEKTWHIKKYKFPKDEVEEIIHKLVDTIKKEEFVHMFNKEDDVLFIVMKNRFFKLPLKKRDESWKEMEEYGEKMGVERRVVENVPLEV